MELNRETLVHDNEKKGSHDQLVALSSEFMKSLKDKLNLRERCALDGILRTIVEDTISACTSSNCDLVNYYIDCIIGLVGYHKDETGSLIDTIINARVNFHSGPYDEEYDPEEDDS